MSAPPDRMIAGNWPSVAANEHDAEPGLMKMKGPKVSTPRGVSGKSALLNPACSWQCGAARRVPSSPQVQA